MIPYAGAIIQAPCPVCGDHHDTPAGLSTRQILKHRLTENRNCPDFDDCLTDAAFKDLVMLPCIDCNRR